ncbi:NmrA family transcriptional regulator [Streptomyces sp. PvR034]|uniref:NmrA family NAD(P)-binding protein n=1 Tax=Streptomyces sp. PvR034 TaxID=3156401 RepID=UPI00339B9DC1
MWSSVIPRGCRSACAPRSRSCGAPTATPTPIAEALDGADRMFWLVPPADFHDAGDARHHYLDFTRHAAHEAARREVRMVGVTSLGHGYAGGAGLLTAALEMDAMIESAGIAYRALALPFFMENLLRQAPAIRQGTITMANAADRPLPTVATRDVAKAAAALLLDPSWTGRARVPVVGPDAPTPVAMAEIVSETLGSAVGYRQIALADFRSTMVRHGASAALARDMAEMVRAQNDGMYDVEPRGGSFAAETGFRQWCQDVLKPALTL